MKGSLRILMSLLVVSSLVAASANASGFKWRDHARPYTFLFGNHIDTHQETRLQKDGGLKGFFYIVFVDDDGDGEIDTTGEGLPIAHHCRTEADYPTCEVGWHIEATPCIKEVNGCEAMFLYHKQDHPVWLIGPHLKTIHEGEPNEETFLTGRRVDLPQPGSPGHLHWLSEGSDHGGTFLPGSIDELEALFGVDIEVPEECNVSSAGQLTAGVICPAYFLEIRAVDTFAWEHGGEKIPVRPGIDLRSHHNFVTSYVAIDLEGTGGDGGGHDH